MRPGPYLAGALFAAVFIAGYGRSTQAAAPVAGPVVPAKDSAFVGSARCRDCHATTHSSWSNGRHSKMLQAATPASVIPAFSGTVSLHDKEYRLERDGDRFFIVEAYLQTAPTKRRVDYTLGSRRVQHYLSRLDDGRIVVLPPSYDVEKKEWFHNLDIVDLEESGQVKVQVWNTNCYGCHVSGEVKGFDAAAKTFDTSWTDFGTACERCHGPGREHAAKYSARANLLSPSGAPASAPDATRSPSIDRDTRIVHPARLDAETSTTLCAQCHTLRDVTREGFAGGANYYDFYTPLLQYAQKRNHDPAYWPNGRPRRFSNEAIAFWESRCFFKGGATCLSCHNDVHEPDIDKNSAVAGKNDSLCAGCHAAIAKQGAEHTHHKTNATSVSAAAPSVSCVSCHMPRTVVSLRHHMPDHTISIPAPKNTISYGIPNACNECHKDRDAAWSEAKLSAWFPNGRRGESEADARAFSLGEKKDPAAVEALARIADDSSRPPLFRANALGYLRNYTSSDAVGAMLRATTAEHPAIRVAAFLSLTDQGRNPQVRAALDASLADTRRTVRMAGALGLLNAGAMAPGHKEMPALEAAMEDHAGRAHFLSDDASTQLDLGRMYFLAGDWKRAESALKDALRLNAKIAGGRYFLALATLGQGRANEAKSLLRSVDRDDPHRKDADAMLAKISGPSNP